MQNHILIIFFKKTALKKFSPKLYVLQDPLSQVKIKCSAIERSI